MDASGKAIWRTLIIYINLNQLILNKFFKSSYRSIKFTVLFKDVVSLFEETVRKFLRSKVVDAA